MVHRLICLLALVLVMSCGPRGQITLAPSAAAVGVVEPIYFATSRGVSVAPELFDTSRTPGVSYARFDVSIPPDRNPGSVDFPGRLPPDPRKHMLTVEQLRFQQGGDFRAALNKSLNKPGSNKRAIIFVHGFNTNLAEGVYRIAQMAHDMELPGTIVHFSWPSAGNAFGYVHDRDSATFSRDALEEVVNEVARSDASEIVLMAHSMGTALAMEALRQIHIRGNTRVQNRIGAVILISPDLDVDVFRSQMAAIKDPPQPFVIFGSPRDRALRLSAVLTGEPARLGNLADTSTIEDLPVNFIDVEAFTDGSSHFALATSPELIELLNKFRDANAWLESDTRRTDNPLTGLLMATGEASRVVLSPVTAVAAATTDYPNAAPPAPKPPPSN